MPSNPAWSTTAADPAERVRRRRGSVAKGNSCRFLPIVASAHLAGRPVYPCVDRASCGDRNRGRRRGSDCCCRRAPCLFPIGPSQHPSATTCPERSAASDSPCRMPSADFRSATKRWRSPGCSPTRLRTRRTLIGTLAIADPGMQQIAVIEIPSLSVIATDDGFNPKLRESILRINVSFADHIGHHDVASRHETSDGWCRPQSKSFRTSDQVRPSLAEIEMPSPSK